MVEVAVVSAIALLLRVPNYQLLGVPGESAAPTFYTASLNDDVKITLESAKFGKQSTPHLKIKLNGNVDQSRQILAALDAWCSSEQREQKQKQTNEIAPPARWCVDANCAWTPSLALEMLEILTLYKHHIVMIEQPFPVELTLEGGGTKEEHKAWSKVKQKYNDAGFPIFADESMRVAGDISRLAHVANGVNIKMEKCGGYLQALTIAALARDRGMALWFGCMVGSRLSMNGTAALVGMVGVVGSDLDGAALVTEECQSWLSGGFDVDGGSIRLSRDAGTGLRIAGDVQSTKHVD
jgi:L-alanine-DL-glutamate epimerase-like enolase superfamily enzyme